MPVPARPIATLPGRDLGARRWPAAMRRCAKASSAALALVAVVAAGGCGGSSASSTYKSQLTTISKDTNAAFASINSPSNHASPERKLAELQSLFNNEARQFANATPPASAKTDNARLVSELKATSRDISSVAAALRGNDIAARRQALTKLGQDYAAVRQTFAKLKNDVSHH